MSRNKEIDLDALVKDLKDSQSASFAFIGFFKATVDNADVSRVIEGSFSGHALDTAIRGVIVSLVFFVTRSLDHNSNSVMRFNRLIEGELELIAERRRNMCPSLDESSLAIGEIENDIAALREQADALIADQRYKALRLHRDEVLAHSLSGSSGFRRKLTASETAASAINYRELCDIAIEVCDLISRVVLIWDFDSRNSADFISIDHQYAADFWSLLPTLWELEAQQS